MPSMPMVTMLHLSRFSWSLVWMFVGGVTHGVWLATLGWTDLRFLGDSWKAAVPEPDAVLLHSVQAPNFIGFDWFADLSAMSIDYILWSCCSSCATFEYVYIATTARSTRWAWMHWQQNDYLQQHCSIAAILDLRSGMHSQWQWRGALNERQQPLCQTSLWKLRFLASLCRPCHAFERIIQLIVNYVTMCNGCCNKKSHHMGDSDIVTQSVHLSFHSPAIFEHILGTMEMFNKPPHTFCLFTFSPPEHCQPTWLSKTIQCPHKMQEGLRVDFKWFQLCPVRFRICGRWMKGSSNCVWRACGSCVS